jgi:peptidoglycan/LPS O-acetylase OafA/YrhL
MGAKSLGYVRQLDGIRAVAVLLVIVSHWFPGDIVGKFGLGAIGVDIFFVLSGFLITRILIVERLNYELNPSARSKLKAIRNFMVRRSLRIFPIYYLLLVLLIIFKDQFPNPVSLDWEWYFFYLQNILFYINQAWPGGKLSHLWSLAVEEQFYLFWPWIILFVSQKWLLKIMVFFFFIGIAFVYLLPGLKPGYNADLLTPSCMQAFSAGGMLAYFHVLKKNTFSNYYKVFGVFGLLAFGSLILGNVGVLPSIIDLRTLMSMVTVGLISSLLYYPNALLYKWILGNKPIVFIGKISYGVYLFHNFIPLLINSILRLLSKKNMIFFPLSYSSKLNEQSIIFYLISFIVLILFSSASFYLFESKIQKFKKYFT